MYTVDKIKIDLILTFSLCNWPFLNRKLWVGTVYSGVMYEWALYGISMFGHCIFVISSFGHCIFVISSFGHCIWGCFSFGHCIREHSFVWALYSVLTSCLGTVFESTLLFGHCILCIHCVWALYSRALSCLGTVSCAYIAFGRCIRSAVGGPKWDRDWMGPGLTVNPGPIWGRSYVYTCNNLMCTILNDTELHWIVLNYPEQNWDDILNCTELKK
jgi:hypothetical protein